MADCKRKTANLFDESTLLNGYYDTTYYQYNQNDNYRCFSLSLQAGTYTIFAKSDVLTIRLLRVSSASLGANTVNLDNQSYTFTLPVSETIYVSLRNSTTTNDFTGLTIMLNTGETALPYEPYGWVHSLRKLSTGTDNITTLPVDLYADGTNATVGLVGNMSQTGTPTPTTPIQPSETGERTAQLYFKKIVGGSIGADGGIVGNASFDCYVAKVEANQQYIGSGYVYAFYTTEPTLGSVSYNGQRVTSSALAGFTAPIDGYVAVRHNSDVTDAMLNSGSTALPYEPYGIKIPISSANTTTPVYLGEVESTRKIQKLILTGQETWFYSSGFFYNQNISPDYLRTSNRIVYCTHYQGINSVTAGGQVGNGECSFYSSPGVQRLYICDDNYSTTDSFKAYLAQQYAAGTPVTVWYVLAESTTGIVNEPLRKIGDYADTVSGITIQTITGKDTFDVQTTLKPSEVELTYTGWHDAEVKEFDGSEWQ